MPSFMVKVQLPNGLRYWRWGGRRNAVQTEKTNSVENCLKMRQNPQRPVHAVLGVFLLCKTPFPLLGS